MSAASYRNLRDRRAKFCAAPASHGGGLGECLYWFPRPSARERSKPPNAADARFILCRCRAAKRNGYQFGTKSYAAVTSSCAVGRRSWRNSLNGSHEARATKRFGQATRCACTSPRSVVTESDRGCARRRRRRLVTMHGGATATRGSAARRRTPCGDEASAMVPALRSIVKRRRQPLWGHSPICVPLSPTRRTSERPTCNPLSRSAACRRLRPRKAAWSYRKAPFHLLKALPCCAPRLSRLPRPELSRIPRARAPRGYSHSLPGGRGGPPGQRVPAGAPWLLTHACRKHTAFLAHGQSVPYLLSTFVGGASFRATHS